MADRETDVDRAHRLIMEQVVTGIRDELVKEMKAEGLEGVGFMLALTDYAIGGAFAYASNVNRQDMIRLLRETIAKLERGA